MEEIEVGSRREIKLHLRLVAVGNYTYRVLSLRPGEEARFSNNYFHETWHILTNQGGAVLLSEILWGLSYQRHEGTVFLLDAPHITTTPFEADEPLPCLFVPDGLAKIDEDLLRALRFKLRRAGSPTTTVKLKLFGMESVDDDFYERHHPHQDEMRRLFQREKMSRRGGFICYTAPAMIMRWQSLSVRRLPQYLFMGSNYTYLAEGDWRKNITPQGEVQIFADFTDRVSAAREARKEKKSLTLREREEVWAKTEKLVRARHLNRKRRSQREKSKREHLVSGE